MRCCHSQKARKLFDEIPEKDVRTWTILVSGFSKNGQYSNALDYFTRMQNEGTIAPNAFTLSSALKCCACINNGLSMGKAIHGWIIRNGIQTDVALENAVLDLYAKFGTCNYVKRFFEMMGANKDSTSWNIAMAANLNSGDLGESLDFFWSLPTKTVSSWNTIIDGLLRRGFVGKALDLLREMISSGCAFDGVTFTISLALASSVKNFDLGRQIHGKLLRSGINYDAFISTALLDMHCKCGKMEKASVIFHNLQLRYSLDESTEKTACWSTMIAGYIQNDMIKDAFACFSSMMHEKVKVGPFTLTTIAAASANASLLELGRQIHAQTLKLGHGQDVFLCSSLIDMYAKCGNLDEAWSFFREARTRNVVLWSVMITSYGVHGWGKEAVELFEQMQEEGIRPNEVSFVGVLTACSHSGLVEDGCRYFKMMTDVYGVQPGVRHFACMVDILGRAGHLKEIKDFVYENEMHHVKQVWKAYLSSCWVHKDAELANSVSKKLFELDPEGSASYLLASNTYSANNIWEEAVKVRRLMVERDVKKLPAQTAEDGNKVEREYVEEDNEDSISGDSVKTALPRFKLFKNFKAFSQIFVYKDELEPELGFEIGFPTNVKHVTHIGLDGNSSSIYLEDSNHVKELELINQLHSFPFKQIKPATPNKSYIL
ncbi:pentatricopeptide repeat-containing protein [Striga asiatica]|uniref:Pentatricopeptide repeat-containing protein n=1 Tax=Striga asiatica TaxID=4170 RepID=A0A5A7RI49_STRAF|nr:pentatricopeptide repeat-containing protein [Striga asiatica]